MHSYIISNLGQVTVYGHVRSLVTVYGYSTGSVNAPLGSVVSPSDPAPKSVVNSLFFPSRRLRCLDDSRDRTGAGLLRGSEDRITYHRKRGWSTAFTCH